MLVLVGLRLHQHTTASECLRWRLGCSSFAFPDRGGVDKSFAGGLSRDHGTLASIQDGFPPFNRADRLQLGRSGYQYDLRSVS